MKRQESIEQCGLHQARSVRACRSETAAAAKSSNAFELAAKCPSPSREVLAVIGDRGVPLEFMKILTPAHKYELANFDNPGYPGQVIQFIEKMPCNELGAPPGAVVTINDGTTNEEVLKMLIDRLNHLQAKFPCRENAIVITHLETGLLWLEKRTADRNARGVEGMHKA